MIQLVPTDEVSNVLFNKSSKKYEVLPGFIKANRAFDTFFLLLIEDTPSIKAGDKSGHFLSLEDDESYMEIYSLSDNNLTQEDIDEDGLFEKCHKILSSSSHNLTPHNVISGGIIQNMIKYYNVHGKFVETTDLNASTVEAKGTNTFSVEDMVLFAEFVGKYYSDIHNPVKYTVDLLEDFKLTR